MRIERRQQTLPNPDAVRKAHMAWLETLVGQDRVYRIVGNEDDTETRWSSSVWSGHELVGAMMATEVFKGGEWMLTTYTIDAEAVP